MYVDGADGWIIQVGLSTLKIINYLMNFIMCKIDYGTYFKDFER